MKLKVTIGVLLVSMLVISTAFNQKINANQFELMDDTPPFLENKTAWADSVFKTLTPNERIAQLFMVAAYSNQGVTHVKKIEDLVVNNKIGGLIFMQGGPLRQAELINRYQEKSKVPLMVSIDGEWGLAMRLDSVVKYPWQMTLGAIQDEQLIYEMGVDIGEQCRRLGIHVNFAPVVDINVNPKNPIINARSFGENKENVANKGIAYMKGMQSVNVMANAKHFPGHGDTDKDSHKALPIINHSKARMDSVELYPFYKLINSGLGSMMVAHLDIPAYAGEDKHYHAGDNRLIVSVKGIRICLQVCYDLRFPVWSRNNKATYDVLLYVANWPERRSVPWKTLLQARAIENMSYVIGVNRVGEDGNGINYSGDSSVFSPLGEQLWQRSGKAVCETITIDKQQIVEARERFPFLDDADNFIVAD